MQVLALYSHQVSYERIRTLDKYLEQFSEDELVGALDALDVAFLMGGVQDKAAQAMSPVEVFQGLVHSSDARVRSAIIPLLLRHPEFADAARRAASLLEGRAQYTLQLFYTAAHLLQKKYDKRLVGLLGVQERLPDLFSDTLGIELSNEIQQSLARTGERHAELIGLKMNYAGGYEHAARTWLDYLEWRAALPRPHTWLTT